MHSTVGVRGAPSTAPPTSAADRSPIGTVVVFAGESWTIMGYHDNGFPMLSSVTSIPGDEDGFEVGTPPDDKAETLDAESRTLAAHAQHMPAGPERAWTFAQASRAHHRSREIKHNVMIHRQAKPRPAARPRGAGRPRAQATRSSCRSGDSGGDLDPEPEPAKGRTRDLTAAARGMAS